MTISNTADTALLAKERLLIENLEQAGSIIIAYSGGVDSSLLAYYARRTLSERAKIVIAVSPSLAQEELVAARSQAEQFAWDLIEISTSEVDKEEYQRNDLMRCYFCKSTLFEELDNLALKLEIARIAYGANVDDLGDFRPGHKAAREHQVLSPLQSAQLTKAEIRELARQAGLPSWDRPQAACLSSRFPTSVPVSAPALSRVDKAESYIHSLGFRQIRVRNHAMAGDAANGEKELLLARIEIEKSELERFSSDVALMQKVDEELKRLGYDFVSLDLAGYRQGSGNALKKSSTAGDDNGSV